MSAVNIQEEVIIPDFDAREKKDLPELDRTQLSGYLTPDQLASLKKQYAVDELQEVVIGNKVAYFKKASRATLRAALSFIDKDRLKYMEVILVNCIVGGDKTILDNDDEFLALVSVVPDLTTGKLSEIKKC